MAIAYFNAHMYAHKSPPAQQSGAASVVHRGGPKLDRPTIETCVSMEQWIMFTGRRRSEDRWEELGAERSL